MNWLNIAIVVVGFNDLITNIHTECAFISRFYLVISILYKEHTN